MTDSQKIADRRVRVASLVIAAAILIAGVCYSSWLLEFVLKIDVDPVNSFLSELDAEGKPYRAVFATADKIVGAMLIPAALAGLLVFPVAGSQPSAGSRCSASAPRRSPMCCCH